MVETRLYSNEAAWAEHVGRGNFRGMQKCARVTLTAHSQAGSLWGGKPVVAADGTVVVVQQDGVGKGEATCVGWDPVEKGRLAFGDSRGNVFVATLRGNRYSLLHRCGHAVVTLAWSPAYTAQSVNTFYFRLIFPAFAFAGTI
ncbi:hypothetical protein DIPPA_14150 [Diplonema papillatum]|nr:hypothetical protein DIPPA_14150 [Diplonema papillatum]